MCFLATSQTGNNSQSYRRTSSRIIVVYSHYSIDREQFSKLQRNQFKNYCSLFPLFHRQGTILKVTEEPVQELVHSHQSIFWFNIDSRSFTVHIHYTPNNNNFFIFMLFCDSRQKNLSKTIHQYSLRIVSNFCFFMQDLSPQSLAKYFIS